MRSYTDLNIPCLRMIPQGEGRRWAREELVAGAQGWCSQHRHWNPRWASWWLLTHPAGWLHPAILPLSLSLWGSRSPSTAELHLGVPRQAQEISLLFHSIWGWIEVGTIRSLIQFQAGEAWLTLMHIGFTWECFPAPALTSRVRGRILRDQYCSASEKQPSMCLFSLVLTIFSPMKYRENIGS